MLQEDDTKKIEILCEKHGKQVVNLIDDNGKHYISECIYCSEERVMKHFGAEIARMHVADALDEIPFNLRDKSLDNFIIEVQEDKEAAIRACLAIYHGELSSTVFIGNPCTGKTHLLAATVTEALRHGKWARYMTERDLLKAIGMYLEFLGNERRVISLYVSCDILAIDNIGAAEQTGRSATILRSIIDKRHAGMRQTMLAGNLTTQELSTYFGDAQLGRLEEDGRIIELKNKCAG
jgi:DNA replication protein DnaC